MNGSNQRITADELRRIRALDDFDLKMFLSEIHDHGFQAARDLLPWMEGVFPPTKERVQ